MVRMEFGPPQSSSEEERDESNGRGPLWMDFETPLKRPIVRASSTPSTVTEMTPTPTRMAFTDSTTPNPGSILSQTPQPTTPPVESFLAVQQGFLNDRDVNTNLFRDPTPSRTRRKRRSFPAKKSRLSQSLLLDDYSSPSLPRGTEKRRSMNNRKLKSFGSVPSPSQSSPESSSKDVSPEGSPHRHVRSNSRNFSLTKSEGRSLQTAGYRARSIIFVWGFLALALSSSLGMILLTRSAVKLEERYELVRPNAPLSAAGLRGQMTSGHWEDVSGKHKGARETKKSRDKVKDKPAPAKRKQRNSRHDNIDNNAKKDVSFDHHPAASNLAKNTKGKRTQGPGSHSLGSSLKIALPPTSSLPQKQKFADQDINMYSTQSTKKYRVVALDPSNRGALVGPPRTNKLYPADFTDNTQLYTILDSSDERLGHMERREPLSDGECVPMQEWQTTFHPSCNGMHELAIEGMGGGNGNDVNLFGTKGFWRYAWRLDIQNLQEQNTLVLKTLKFTHNFEDAHFEHDRVDAVAMERLTSSPHVIDVFGFCGHSVLTEYADGPRLGELADKSKRKPLARLKIARDIAHGLADVHGIDGDGNATFVHLDVNPANVVSIGGTLKLNDFNIGIIRRWNTTSNEPCGFPAQYPNPQWRSPEEARNEQNLTEKVDIFSMGHIFFRLICGHEPWNKLEPGGRPSKEEVIVKVQRGDLPFIPEAIRHSQDPEIVAIKDAMMSCYTFDASKRPSARTVADALDKALKALTAQHKHVTES